MRIGIMCLASFGGSARIATQLAIKLAYRGHRVHLFTRTTPFGDRNYASGVVMHTVTPNRELDLHPARLFTDWSAEDYQTFLAGILDVIATEGLDILHFHYAVPFAFMAAEIKQILGRQAPPLIGTLHGTDVSIYGRDQSTKVRLTEAIGYLNAVTTVSASHARLASNLFKLSVRPQVIPNFIDLSNFQYHRPLFSRQPYPASDQTTDAKATNESKPRLVHLSNFRAVKDTRSMAHIFLRIRQQMESELWLIGDGPDMETVKAVLRQGQVEEDVHYWGLQHDVAPLLAQTDLLLMTSLSESFCLAALEAMACGVPVLSTRVGGLPEVVIHGKTGFLFPVGDQKTAARFAVDLLSDPTRQRMMREMAVRQAARYDHHQIVPIYENLYQRLLYRQPRKVPSFIGLSA